MKKPLLTTQTDAIVARLNELDVEKANVSDIPTVKKMYSHSILIQDTFDPSGNNGVTLVINIVNSQSTLSISSMNDLVEVLNNTFGTGTYAGAPISCNGVIYLQPETTREHYPISFIYTSNDAIILNYLKSTGLATQIMSSLINTVNVVSKEL